MTSDELEVATRANTLETTPPPGKARTPKMGIFWVAVLLVASVQATIAGIIIYLLPDWPTRGQFGDLFGLTNSLFSGVAFAGLLYTILLQKEELRLQRLELSLTRQELARTATAQENSERALQEQAANAGRSASLASVNFLLNRYEDRIAFLNKRLGAGMSDETLRHERATLAERKQALEKIVDSTFSDVLTQWGEK